MNTGKGKTLMHAAFDLDAHIAKESERKTTPPPVHASAPALPNPMDDVMPGSATPSEPYLPSGIRERSPETDGAIPESHNSLPPGSVLVIPETVYVVMLAEGFDLEKKESIIAFYVTEFDALRAAERHTVARVGILALYYRLGILMNAWMENNDSPDLDEPAEALAAWRARCAEQEHFYASVLGITPEDRPAREYAFVVRPIKRGL